MSIKESELKEWKSGNRFVAYIDILGFKEMLGSQRKKDEVYIKLRSLFDRVARFNVDENRSNDSNVVVYNFSDSFCIFTKDDSDESFYSFTLRCREIMTSAIDLNLPLKGAVAFGYIDIDVYRRIFVGQPMVDAVLLEADLHYIGIVVHHSAEDFVNGNKIASPMKEKIHTRYYECITPFKTCSVAHWNVDWFNAYTFMKKEETLGDHDFENLKNQIRKMRSMTSGKPRKYYENTLMMVDERMAYRKKARLSD